MWVMAMTVWGLRQKSSSVGMFSIQRSTIGYKGAYPLQGNWHLRTSMGTCTMRKELVMSCKA